ncbi:MAG: IS256 family transposase, partial [Candidatus Latescibacteria bacterium]|nr:IS256 family transposase [Candidatus Latescibacterota bacterium]
MTRHCDNKAIDQVLEVLIENGLDGMASAFEIIFNEAMKIERSAFLEAGPHERTSKRRGYSNGFKPKEVNSKVGKLKVNVPQVRDLKDPEESFYPKSLDKDLRSERALKLAVAEMYVNGVSTRKVKNITRKLCGLDISSTQVSRASKLLDEELQKWRNRPLGEIPYLQVDARYEKVRHGGSVVDCAVLTAVGVREDGRRSILGTSVSLSEAEVHWREFIASLQERGMHGVVAVTSDDHKGIRAALQARLTGVLWQRCQFHLQQNAQKYAPRISMRKEVAKEIRNIFNAPDRNEAEERLSRMVRKYRKKAPRLAEWAEENLPEGLTVFELPESHRRRLRTTNGLERVNEEIKRRTRVARLFPNEASLLRLVSAVLSEISEEWETGRRYLNMENEWPADR